MQLIAGTRYDDLKAVPANSRPTEPIVKLADLPRGQGNKRPPRIAPDGTRWCVGCNTVMGSVGRPTCDSCRARRASLLESERRARATVEVREEPLRETLCAISDMERALGRLLAAVETRQITRERVSELTLVCKRLSVLGSQLEPVRRRTQASEATASNGPRTAR